jgi:hypothetical protein
MEFKDTYNLVCNSEPDARILDWSSPAMVAAVAAMVAPAGIPRTALIELQRHCIALRMHGDGDNERHLDFTYEPKDCEFQLGLLLLYLLLGGPYFFRSCFSQPDYIMHSFCSFSSCRR